MLRRPETCSLTTTVEHTPVEWRIVSRQKFGRLNQCLNIRPHIAKRRAVLDGIPGDAMYIREYELPPRRPDQLIEPLDNARTLNKDDANGTGAVLPLISRLEINSGKDAHWCASRNATGTDIAVSSPFAQSLARTLPPGLCATAGRSTGPATATVPMRWSKTKPPMPAAACGRANSRSHGSGATAEPIVSVTADSASLCPYAAVSQVCAPWRAGPPG